MQKVVEIIFKLMVWLPVMGLSSCWTEISFVPELERNQSALQINNRHVNVDTMASLALVPVKSLESNMYFFVDFLNDYLLHIDGQVIEPGSIFDFKTDDNGNEFQVEFTNEKGAVSSMSLYFTSLPVIHIVHKFSEIPSDKKIIAAFSLEESVEDTVFSAYCGIEVRGGTSRSYPKKSYAVQFRDNTNDKTARPYSLLGMRNHASWILDAVYIDKLGTRNRTSFDIWGQMQQHGFEQGLDFLYSATRGRMVELFVNNQYMGIYCLNEMVDEAFLPTNELSELPEGFLYKASQWSGAVRFESYTDTLRNSNVWEGWELKWPDAKEQAVWKPLFDFTQWVIDIDDEVFLEEIEQRLSLDQAMDYYIFVNLILGVDNLGKNLFMAAKKAASAFYICPWDLDAAWGRDWQGFEVGPNGAVTYRLPERLIALNPNGFNKKLKTRWFHLRQSILSYNNIVDAFAANHTDLLNSGAFERESKLWPGSKAFANAEIAYIEQWILARLNFLDYHFETF